MVWHQEKTKLKREEYNSNKHETSVLKLFFDGVVSASLSLSQHMHIYNGLLLDQMYMLAGAIYFRDAVTSTQKLYI